MQESTPRPGGVGPAVRQAREARRLSLRELARRLEVSPATLSAIENGKVDITVGRLHRIADALGTTADRLLRSGGPAAPAGTAEAEPGGAERDWRVFGPLDIDPVLSAAIGVFVAAGYHGATVREIAARAGMSVPGVYHHYPSKQHLLVATLDRTLSELLWRVRAARREGSTPARRVALVVEALALFHTHRREPAFIGASEMRSLHPANRRRITALRNDVQHILDAEIDAAVREGTFTTPHPRHAARAIATMCTSLPQWFRTDGPSTPEQIAREYAGFALGLLGARSSAV
ncbi:TetR family transcriptional regulator [Streptomyces purpurogeneiscleroticus]|uniref:TetR family transcriptional regulator n=1 Tax=Streptomyces purpurogeneiscleroticus TaxID=68259 RepID=UPI001CBBE70C|nr:TetR family transcriptional regulator [Streptomyces purpurogeneiscleroticus]MBZ4016592.1 transcriptional regulator [Streptomyces purpurogeneiscleroticus]